MIAWLIFFNIRNSFLLLTNLMKEITLPAPKKIMISPSETTFENAWQYRRTCPLKISNSPFRINGFVHKKTSPLKKFHYAFSPSMLINNLYWECPAIKGDLFLDHKEQSISNNFLYAQNGLARPPKTYHDFPLPNDEQLRSRMSDNTAWHIPSTYEAFHLESLLFRTK